jgi:biopolymer transport protein ExbD
MADDQAWRDPVPEEDERPVLPRRPVRETAEMDITPMIDIVFLLLIFFLVCSTTAVQSPVELPPARYGVGTSERTSTVITIANPGGPGPAPVCIGDGKAGSPLPEASDPDAQDAAILQAVSGKGITLLPNDPAEQRELVTRAVSMGYEKLGKSTVLVKAEKGVKHGDVWRVELAAGAVDGIRLRVAVLEVE